MKKKKNVFYVQTSAYLAMLKCVPGEMARNLMVGLACLVEGQLAPAIELFQLNVMTSMVAQCDIQEDEWPFSHASMSGVLSFLSASISSCRPGRLSLTGTASDKTKVALIEISRGDLSPPTMV